DGQPHQALSDNGVGIPSDLCGPNISIPQIGHDPSPTHGPLRTMANLGACRVHAETGRWSPLLHFATPPAPGITCAMRRCFHSFAHHPHPSEIKRFRKPFDFLSPLGTV